MELLLETNDPNEINEIKILLESNGIPVFIGNENTARNLQYIQAAAKLTLWVYIKDQYQDAKLLLQDSSHEVKNKVNVEEFYSTLDTYSQKSRETIVNRFMLAMVLIAIGVFICVAYYRATI
ncbi:MAG: DUF2007 domain-containing protein [Pseudohongiellaceae bacterium]|nr:DUF2007 domain-containing protein [Pseudohongiellaceae bacterium]